MIKVCKIKDFQLVTASGAIWKVTILGDKETMGHKYAEAHIKPLLGELAEWSKATLC